MQGPPNRPAPFLRLGLVVLALPNLASGLFALVAPQDWFDTFSVGDLGGYNDHLVRDVGGAFVATSVLLLVAAVWIRRSVIYTALTGWLLFNVPHLINHIVERGALSDTEYATVLGILGFNVLLAVILWLATRRRRPPA
ncbi:MAG: hypothetical protein ACRDI3_00945 [Actinomycetota bacterium]